MFKNRMLIGVLVCFFLTGIFGCGNNKGSSTSLAKDENNTVVESQLTQTAKVVVVVQIAKNRSAGRTISWEETQSIGYALSTSVNKVEVTLRSEQAQNINYFESAPIIDGLAILEFSGVIEGWYKPVAYAYEGDYRQVLESVPQEEFFAGAGLISKFTISMTVPNGIFLPFTLDNIPGVYEENEFYIINAQDYDFAYGAAYYTNREDLGGYVNAEFYLTPYVQNVCFEITDDLNDKYVSCIDISVQDFVESGFQSHYVDFIENINSGKVEGSVELEFEKTIWDGLSNCFSYYSPSHEYKVELKEKTIYTIKITDLPSNFFSVAETIYIEIKNSDGEFVVNNYDPHQSPTITFAVEHPGNYTIFTSGGYFGFYKIELIKVSSD